MIGSTRLAEARPVRSPASSLRSTSNAPSMRRRKSLSSASSAISALLRDDGEQPLAGHHIGESARIVNGKDQDGYPVLSRQRDRRRIHDLEIARQHFEIIQSLEALRTWNVLLVGAIDAIHLGRLQHGI